MADVHLLYRSRQSSTWQYLGPELIADGKMTSTLGGEEQAV